jgi:phospholipase/carboxylesterase
MSSPNSGGPTIDQPAALAGIPHRIRLPAGDGPHPTLIMVHGHQGDETVTWIFGRSAGPNVLVASPRAPFEAERGFTWFQFREGHTDPESYRAGIDHFEKYLAALKATYPIDAGRLVVLGFSQGAAVAYAYGIGNPSAVRGVAALAGFIPGVIAKPLPPLNGLPVLILHGTDDETISINIARKNHQQLQEANAQVTYLEEPVGHRVGTKGMRLLAQWLAEHLA